MDYNEFAEKIKTKYPQYKDMDNRELATRMVEKYPQYNDVTFDTPTPKQEKRGIDLTPSGLVNKASNAITGAIEAPIRMIKDNQTLGEAYKSGYQEAEETQKRLEKEMPIATGLNRFITDTAAYSALPVLRGGGIGRFLGNAVIQGGVPGALEGLKEGEPLTGAGVGTGAAIGVQSALAGLPYVGRGIQRVINNPNVQNAVTKGLEALTSVPQKFSQRALDAELGGNSLFKGKFNVENAYRPIEQKLRNAKGMLPTAESYADDFYKLGQKAKIGIENIKNEANQEINDMLGRMNPEPIQINGLKNSLDSLVKSYARGGDINPAEIRAGRDIELVRNMLGMKNDEQITQELTNYFQNNRLNKEAGAVGSQFDKEAQEAAFNVLAQATGKNKQWLKSQLNANLPKMSTQKRQEFIQNLLEHTDDKLEAGTIDPTWSQYFPELNQAGEQYGISGTDIAHKAFDRIMGKNFRVDSDPQSALFDQLDNKYDKLLYNLTKKPTQEGIDEAFIDLGKMLNGLDDSVKDIYVNKLTDDIENVSRIGNNPVKPIDLHNAKEILYDMANYDTAGGTRNVVLKGMANQINNYTRNKYPKYKAPNDKFSMIKTLENDLGGINSNTIANKLANYGSSQNIASGLDRKLRSINAILPYENRFIDQTKNLVNSQNKVNNINKLINQSYERNPRLLSNINDTAREEALEDLQKMTGVNFMDDLNDVRAREALENLFPGQGGGSGSSQGFGNLLRTAIIGGTPMATALTGNPTALLGLGVISPKIMAQGTIKNIGRLYNLANQKISPNIQRLFNPLAARMATPMLYGGVEYNEY